MNTAVANTVSQQQKTNHRVTATQVQTIESESKQNNKVMGEATTVTQRKPWTSLLSQHTEQRQAGTSTCRKQTVQRQTQHNITKTTKHTHTGIIEGHLVELQNAINVVDLDVGEVEVGPERAIALQRTVVLQKESTALKR